MDLVELFVKHVLSKSCWASTLQLGDHVPNLLDGIDLFFQILILKKLGEMRIIVATCSAMEFQERLQEEETLLNHGPDS